MKLARRALILRPSPTLALSTRAKELASQGHAVINLSVGEPDWSTPEVVNQAGIQAIREGFTKYTPPIGILPLREKIAQITSKELGVSYSASDVLVATGAKFVIAALLQMLVEEGDEVLVPSPYWVSYPTMVELAGAKPCIVNCSVESGFKLSAAALSQVIGPKTRALILCSPSNPTGFMYSRKELGALVQVLRQHPEITILSDDIYNHLTFSEEMAPHILQVAPDFRDRVVVVNGASKTFAMTGWRVGWALGPKDLIRVTGDYLSQTTSNLTSISQKACLAGLQDQGRVVAEARGLLKQRCDAALNLLKGVPGLEVHPPDGAFYFWVDVSRWFGKSSKSGISLKGSKEVAEALLNEQYVAAVPGVEFGAEGYLRLSYAVSEKEFAEAVHRLSIFAKN